MTGSRLLSMVAATLLLAVDARADTVTGRYATVTMDGSLADWQAGDVFYTDGEIGDGAPASSTYSNIFVVNDSTYLFLGLQLKAPGSIYSNWTHEIYIDSDNNPATGFNSGWMSGGYDRLVQYGVGGSVYSIYSFSGGNQWEWSWNFVNTIGYSFNNENIEWSIPRADLGGGTAARIEFHVGGGDVSIETWANAAEASARTYAFAPIPTYTLQVVTARGSSVPAAGIYTNTLGTSLSPTLTAQAPANGTQYLATGWTLTGHDPVSGSTTNFSMTVTNHALLTWTWVTNVQFTRSADAHGTVSGPSDGYYQRNSSVTVTAAADNGYVFAGWSGAIPTGQTNDNPLALTLDRARSITATFVPDYGRFAPTIVADGSLVEWQAGDEFYTDAEIGDGLPLNSSYSSISVANDQTYLYVGLQLKAASSIFSNWTHELYIDTDNNPATGFNAGWMGGGYDRLVQYGVGGTVYSIYAFAGSNQADWSWNFLNTIGYAYNGDVVEWVIPRSELGGSTAARMEFHVLNGDVTVETWAHQSESSAHLYTMALTPTYTLQVVNARGSASPAVGLHTNAYGTALSPTVTAPAAANGTQYVATGWAMTGHDPASGSTTNFSMTVTNHAVLTWQWSTNVQFTRTAGASGSVTGDTNGYYANNAAMNVTAVPDAGYLFGGWSGDVPAGQTNDNPLTLTLDRKRAITANFRAAQGRYVSIAVNADLGDWTDADVFYADPDIGDGLPVNSSYSNVMVANDLTYLYIGLQLKAPSSVNSNWTHNLYIDSDLNPNTGFDGGWMGNGYDRLIQYGANGAVFSIYAFTGGTQVEWSWNFLGTITYAFNEERLEWALPRSQLGMTGTQCKLEFQTTDGSVTLETWAHQTEADARVYTMGAPPTQWLQIVTSRGTSTPAAGTYTHAYGSELTNRVTAPAAANGTQYVSLGWAMTGNDPLSGAATNFTMTLTNTAVLTWQWQTNVQFTRSAGLGGSATGPASGYYALNSSVTVTAVPNGGYVFAGWTGDVPGGQASDNPLTLALDRARAVTATYTADVGHYRAVTLDGSLAEWQPADVFYTDAEIGDGLPLNSSYSNVMVANDLNNLYVGLQAKAPSSIYSNWTHEIYIDTDLNPATGFNAGWMGGGYDRLVQYGVGGTVYSIYSFSGSSQGDWSWDFIGTIGYSFNEENIEWAIPRSLLGDGTVMRLEFHVGGADISVETWAHQTEASAKNYSFASPNDCPSGLQPLLAAVSDKSIHANSTLNFQVTATDPFCVAPTLTCTGLPSGATFDTSESDGARIGAFAWTPAPADAGTHPLRFVATDDEGLSTSFVMRVYVGQAGESTNAAGVPVSQTNWAVSIADIAIPASGNVTVQWDSVAGITYDVFTSDNNFGGAMTWSKVVSGTEAEGATEAAAIASAVSQRYVQVTLAGTWPNSNQVWGVIRPTVQAATFTLMSPPLDGDRAFDGAFGSNLAAVLTGYDDGAGDNHGDEVFIMEANQSWRNLYVDSQGVWRETGGAASTYELSPGQGFYVLRNTGSSAQPRFSGPVGNTGAATNTLVAEWNLIGFSQGRHLPIGQAFTNLAQGAPTASWDETAADLIVLQNSNGSWRRIMRSGTGTWFDLSTFATANLNFTPGQAVYYYRQSASGQMKVRF